MEHDFKIKIVEDKEWELLLKIACETFAATFQHLNTKENFDKYIAENLNGKCVKKELANAGSVFYFYYFKKQLAGYVKLNENDAQTEELGASAIEIERIYLYEKFQGKGLGRKMMEHIFKIASEKNKSKIWLGVWEENIAAIKFYEKLGFKKIGSHEFYLGNDLQTDFLYAFRME